MKLNRSKLSLAFATLLIAGTAFAGTTVNLTLQSGGPADAGVLVYPYTVTVSGSTTIADGTYFTACDSFFNHLDIGESWPATINTMNDLGNTKFGAGDKVQYEAAAWLISQMIGNTDAQQVGDLNFALWNLFQDVSHTAGYTAGAEQDYEEALNPKNLAFMQARHIVIFTPTDLSGDGPQELIGYLPNAPVPEPGSLALFGTGISSLGLAIRRLRQR